MCKSTNSDTIFNTVEFQEGEWFDYDEKVRDFKYNRVDSHRSIYALGGFTRPDHLPKKSIHSGVTLSYIQYMYQLPSCTEH